jgi:hypothetical protein
MAFLSNQGEQMVSSEPSNLRKEWSSWRNDIQSLVKKCRILALYFLPKCRIGVECLTRGGGGVHVDRCNTDTAPCQRRDSNPRHSGWESDVLTIRPRHSTCMCACWAKKMIWTVTSLIHCTSAWDVAYTTKYFPQRSVGIEAKEPTKPKGRWDSKAITTLKEHQSSNNRL